MKRILGSLVLLFVFSGIGQAQTAHSATFTWTPPPIIGVNYHVWRAPCTVAIAAGVCPPASEGPFVSIGGTFISGTTPAPTAFVDTTVVAATNYSYYVTAFCPAGGTCPSNYVVNSDSIPSSHIGAAIPADAPIPVPAPTNLTVIVK